MTTKNSNELENFKGCNILVVGDMMLDKYIRGNSYRMSPEAPVPVTLVDNEISVLGGAGNVVNNLSSLGANVTVAGVVGKDESGGKIRSLLNKINDNVTECLTTDPSRVTTRKTRIINDGQQVIRVDREMTHDLPENIADYLLKMIGKINKFDAVIVSDYGKGVITPYVFGAIMEQAELFDVFVSVDPNGTDYSKYRGANIITPNRKEAKAVSCKDSLTETAKIIMDDAELPQLLITCSEDGMMLFEHSDIYYIETEAKKVFDVSGAGDTVIAAFTLAAAAGCELKKAAHISNVAAGIVVGKVGTSTVSFEELDKALNRKAVLSKWFQIKNHS